MLVNGKQYEVRCLKTVSFDKVIIENMKYEMRKMQDNIKEEFELIHSQIKSIKEESKDLAQMYEIYLVPKKKNIKI